MSGNHTERTARATADMWIEQKREIEELRVRVAADAKILRERADWIAELINERDAVAEALDAIRTLLTRTNPND